jgi:uncharacterized membrane protein YdcZ (DUF606 family)
MSGASGASAITYSASDADRLGGAAVFLFITFLVMIYAVLADAAAKIDVIIKRIINFNTDLNIALI